jgi:hypothetical protein
MLVKGTASFAGGSLLPVAGSAGLDSSLDVLDPIGAVAMDLRWEPKAGFAWKERDGTRATPAAADGDLVGQTLHPSSAGVYYTAPADGQRGTLKVAGAVRYVQLDGVDDFYNFPNLVLAGDFEFIAAIRQTGDNGLLSNQGGQPTFRIGNSADKLTFTDGVSSAVLSNVLSPAQGNDMVVGFRRESTTLTFTQDGVDIGSGVVTVVSVTVNQLWALFGAVPLNDRAYFAALKVGAAFTAPNRATVTTYAGVRQGRAI